MQYAITKQGRDSTVYVTKISRDGYKIDFTRVYSDAANPDKTPCDARQFKTLDAAKKALTLMQNGLFDDYGIVQVSA
jgi:hypothetical protein